MRQVYSVTWTERHSALVMAETQEQAERLTYGVFDADDTFEDYLSQEVGIVVCPDSLTVPSKGALMRSAAPDLLKALGFLITEINDKNEGDRYLVAIEVAEQAVAKAEGGE